MAWKFDNNIPIYIQISNTIKLQIVTNQLKSGDKLPTVRDLVKLLASIQTPFSALCLI